MNIADSSFFASVRGSRRILVTALGGLGDVVHSVPMLRSIRLSFPEARIEVLTPVGAVEFLSGIEGIDRIIPHGGRHVGWSWADLRQLWMLLRQRYDLCINFWGSNHASAIALSTLAAVRLGRVPSEHWKRAWRFCHSHIVDYPHLREPLHQQWTSILEGLGLRVDRSFSVRYDERHYAETGLDPALRGRFIHLSPSASHPAKDIVLPVMVEVAVELSRRLPHLPLVITTTRQPRHQQRLEAVLAALPRPPLAVFSGSLNTAALFSVIQNAALHVSADSGPVHMAVMAGTPSVSWFLQNPYVLEYLPTGERHFAFVVDKQSEEGIVGIDAAAIAQKCLELISSQQARTGGDPAAQAAAIG